jgi:hypothetical protein
MRAEVGDELTWSAGGTGTRPCSSRRPGPRSGVRPHIRPLLLARQRCSGAEPASPDVTWWSEVPARRTAATILALPSVGRAAVGLPACLAAVSAGPVQTLVVPGDGLVPGYECGRCGTLSLDADACCPDWGVAALPVPDVIEEMVSRVLEDGGDVLVAGSGWPGSG